MQPLISVIVPVYNGERYLKNCIESIEAQSYEIIVINDGSTDRTAEVCEKLVQSYRNLSFITTEDLGVSASRNHGIALAKGELLTFVDADDRIHPQMLQRLYGAMERTGSDIAGCRFTIWNTEREWEIVANSVPVGDQTYKLYEKQEYLRDQIVWKQPVLEQTVPQSLAPTDAYRRVVQRGNDHRRGYAFSYGSAAQNRNDC